MEEFMTTSYETDVVTKIMDENWMKTGCRITKIQ